MVVGLLAHLDLSGGFRDRRALSSEPSSGGAEFLDDLLWRVVFLFHGAVRLGWGTALTYQLDQFSGGRSRSEIHYQPEHGSWLDMAEVEQSVMARQRLVVAFKYLDYAARDGGLV